MMGEEMRNNLGVQEENDADTVKNVIAALLESSDAQDAENTFDYQQTAHETTQLCQDLLKTIQSRKKDLSSTSKSTFDEDENFTIRTSIAQYSNTAADEKPNVRQVLQNLPSSTTSKLAPLLTDLMSDRVDVAELLPATQDDVANDEAISKMAITLTQQAFLAAELYVELVGMPGAWGAGLVNVGALSGLSALMKRWRAECCGNQDQENDEIFGDGRKRKQSKPPSNNNARTKRSRENHSQNHSVIAQDSSDDDEESVDSSPFIVDNEDDEDNFSPVLSKRDLVVGGLRVARALAKAELGNEFVVWSLEAREAFIDSVVTALLTTAAMFPNAGKKAKQSSDTELETLKSEVAALLSDALKNCFALSSVEPVSDEFDEELDSEYERMERNHDTSIAIFRGLFPALVMQTELPNGHKGKEAARDISLSTLEGITEVIAKRYESADTAATPSTTLKTPNTEARTPTSSKSNVDAAPTTGRSSRKKRVSFFGNLSDVMSPEKIAPPSLKASSTPMRHRALVATGLTPTNRNDRPRPVLSAILGLLQKLATFKGLDRANTRSNIIDALCKMLPHLPLLERTAFLRFLIHLCHSKVSVHRLMCVELVGSILSKPWLWNEHSSQNVSPLIGRISTNMTPSSRASFSPIVECSTENMPLALLRILQGRIVDRAPAVRARAAIAVSDMLESIAEQDNRENDADVHPLAGFVSALEVVSNGFARKLRKRAALDDGATVRKAAINAFVDLIVFDKSTQSLCSEADIAMLGDLCSDTSVAVRKAAAFGLTDLLLHFTAAEFADRDILYVLEETWPTAVMPMVGDMEPSCVSTAVDLFYRTTIEPLVGMSDEDLSSDKALPPQCVAAWKLLARVSDQTVQEGASRGEYGALRTLVGKLAELYDADVTQRLVVVARLVAIQSLETEEEDHMLKGSWCLLEAIADQEKRCVDLAKLTRRRTFSLSFLRTSLEKLFQASRSQERESFGMIHSAMKSCMKVISKWAAHLHLEDSQRLTNGLKERIRSFELPTELAGAAILSLVALTDSACEDQTKTKEECSAWIKELNKNCEDCIAAFVASTTPSSNDEIKVVRALFTVGELSMIGFKADEDVFSSSSAPQKSNVHASKDPVAGLHVPPSDRLLSLGQAMLAKNLPKSDEATPEAVRAQAFLALGKLCLRNESLAKRSLTLLVQELHQSDGDMCPSVQSNALLVLGDLCVRYTNLVDRYLPVMARCLQSGITEHNKDSLFDVGSDRTSLVRKHAVLLLTGLLLQDYIKWRGLLFQRFLVATADRDEGVARLAEMSLCGPLLKKYPKLFFNNFVESVFVLNKCTAHPLYAAAAAAGDNGGGVTVGFEGINLSGEAGRAARIHIYGKALAKMSSEEKIGITARLANDVLGAALKTDGDLARVCKNPSVASRSDDNAYNVLSDTLFILTSPVLQVAKASAREDGDGVDDTGIESSKAHHVAAAKGKLLSKISRKHLVEMVLPILCNLKTTLQESCSPLLKDLMQYLVVIFRAYKVEVKEYLANDPTLLQEVEYDARQFKRMQRLNSPSGAVVVVSQ